LKQMYEVATLPIAYEYLFVRSDIQCWANDCITNLIVIAQTINKMLTVSLLCSTIERDTKIASRCCKLQVTGCMPPEA
jgi:hypothetical protein